MNQMPKVEASDQQEQILFEFSETYCVIRFNSKSQTNSPENVHRMVVLLFIKINYYYFVKDFHDFCFDAD